MKSKKILYLLAALIVVALLCGVYVKYGESKMSASTESECVASSEEVGTGNDETDASQEAADRMRDIYAQIIANGRDSVETGAGSYGYLLFDTPDYLSEDYYQWYRRTEDYDDKMGNEGMRFHDFDHWGTMQEFSCITKAEVKKSEVLSNGRVRVDLDLEFASYNIVDKEPNYTATQPVALVLVKERDGWFVDDFLDKDGDSEKAQMKEYLKEEAEAK